MKLSRSRVACQLLMVIGLAACHGRVSTPNLEQPGARPSTRPGAEGEEEARTGATSRPAAPAADRDGDGVADDPTSEATCRPGATEAVPLQRLTDEQYRNALSDVLAAWLPQSAAQILEAGPVVQALVLVPEDTRSTRSADKHGGFRRLDQAVQQQHVEAGLAVAQAVGAQLTATPERIAELLGSCASDGDGGNDAECVRGFIERVGARAERRTLTDEDVEFYLGVYAADGIDAAALSDLIAVMLSSPYFLYQVEHGDGNVGGDVYELSSEEIANRLSLHFWNSTPDDRLLEMAAAGELTTEAGYAAAVEYVVSSPRTGQMLREFFREWLSLEDLQEMDRFNGTTLFDAVRGDFEPGPDTRENMIEEAVQLGLYYASRDDGTFSDLFTTPKSFATTADVAGAYGVDVWSGQGEPPDMPDAARTGLLTHAGLVATGSPETRPIMKGVFLRTTLLCDTVPPPPDNALDLAREAAAMLDPVMSTRTRTEALTQQPNSVCISCHGTLINPLGFITENFDSLGRLRTTQTVFDDDGQPLGEVAVDTRVSPQIVGGDMAEAQSASELAALLLDSGKPQACFARKYFRYTFARLEQPELDECALVAVRNGLMQGEPLIEVLSRVAYSDAFRQRKFD